MKKLENIQDVTYFSLNYSKKNSWPLIIDPQSQATRFIKRIETKVDDKNFVSIKPGKFIDKIIEQVIQIILLELILSFKDSH